MVCSLIRLFVSPCIKESIVDGTKVKDWNVIQTGVKMENLNHPGGREICDKLVILA